METQYLRRNEFVPYAPDERGQTIHKHHCKEGKGNDRLYVTLADDGSVLAFCHHCGKRGYSRPGRNFTLPSKSRAHKARYSRRCYPTDSSTDFGNWSANARTWIERYGITQKEVTSYEVRYSPKEDQIFFLRRKPDSSIGFLQSRTFSGEGPKYMTHRLDFEFPEIYLFGGGFGDTVALVEDYVSAIKLARYMPTVPLFGVNLREHILDFLLKRKFANVLIYLDNDNPQVVVKRTQLHCRLQLLFDCVKLITWEYDPKACSDEQLRSLAQ